MKSFCPVCNARLCLIISCLARYTLFLQWCGFRHSATAVYWTTTNTVYAVYWMPQMQFNERRTCSLWPTTCAVYWTPQMRLTLNRKCSSLQTASCTASAAFLESKVYTIQIAVTVYYSGEKSGNTDLTLLECFPTITHMQHHKSHVKHTVAACFPFYCPHFQLKYLLYQSICSVW